MTELRLAMELAAQHRLNEIQRYQLNATTAMLSNILQLTASRFPDANAAIVELFESDIQEREDVQHLVLESSPWIDIKEGRPIPGTRILMVGYYESRPVTARVDATGLIFIEEGEERRIHTDPPDEPTYWMYVPEPPLSR